MRAEVGVRPWLGLTVLEMSWVGVGVGLIALPSRQDRSRSRIDCERCPIVPVSIKLPAGVRFSASARCSWWSGHDPALPRNDPGRLLPTNEDGGAGVARACPVPPVPAGGGWGWLGVAGGGWGWLGEPAADADRTRTERRPHEIQRKSMSNQRNGRGPDADRTRAEPFLLAWASRGRWIWESICVASPLCCAVPPSAGSAAVAPAGPLARSARGPPPLDRLKSPEFSVFRRAKSLFFFALGPSSSRAWQLRRAPRHGRRGRRAARRGGRRGRPRAAARRRGVGGAQWCVPPREGGALHPRRAVRRAALGRRREELRPHSYE
eukprot:gene22482-biopygen16251